MILANKSLRLTTNACLRLWYSNILTINIVNWSNRRGSFEFYAFCRRKTYDGMCSIQWTFAWNLRKERNYEFPGPVWRLPLIFVNERNDHERSERKNFVIYFLQNDLLVTPQRPDSRTLSSLDNGCWYQSVLLIFIFKTFPKNTPRRVRTTNDK